MAGIDLLSTPSAFRSNMFSLSRTPNNITSTDKSSSGKPGNQVSKIDFENILKGAMSPTRHLPETKEGIDSNKLDTFAIKKTADHNQPLQFADNMLPPTRQVSAELAMKMYNALSSGSVG